MLASLAAIGISEVFATMSVLFMRGSPERKSFNLGNLPVTSAISFPRSPQPTRITMSASAHCASVSNITVFPVPNPPGIVAVPPLAKGKKESIIR